MKMSDRRALMDKLVFDAHWLNVVCSNYKGDVPTHEMAVEISKCVNKVVQSSQKFEQATDPNVFPSGNP